MKTRIVRLMVLGGAMGGLVLCAGCEEGKASAETPVFTAAAVPTVTEDKPAPATPPPPTTAPTTVAPAVALEATNAVSSTNVSATTPGARVVQNPTTPSNLKISPALDEIVKLAQAGVTEEVMLAYIANSTNIYDIGSNEIVYLNDLGVSSTVVTTLIQHDTSPDTLARKQAAVAVKPLPPGVALTTPATNVYPPKAVMTPPPPPQPNLATDPVVPPPADGQTVVTAPAEAVTVNYFYDTLSPYGNWVDVQGYGRCWQPTVAVSNPYWRPYADNGCWLWSDSGWYWHSYYSWGWAPFHYGRWCSYPSVGWLWVPDTCWGPSWVSWRYTTYHCGWAPLPPECHYVNGFGLYYRNSSVSVGFNFGLASSCYTFIPLNRFCERNPRHYYLSPTHASAVFKESTVINNYVVGNNNTVINHGIGRDRVAKVTRAEVPHVKIREVPMPKDQSARAERIEKSGSALLVSSPQLPKGAATASTGSRTSGDAKAGLFVPGHKAVVTDEKTKSGSTKLNTGRPEVASVQTPTGTPSPILSQPSAKSGTATGRSAGGVTAVPTPKSAGPVIVTGAASSGQRDIRPSSQTGRGAPSLPPTPNNAGIAKAPTTSYFNGANPNYSRPPTTSLPAPSSKTTVPPWMESQRNDSQPGRPSRAPAARPEAPPVLPPSVGRPAPSAVPSSGPVYTAPAVRSEAHHTPAPSYRSEPVHGSVAAPSHSAPSRAEAPARSAPSSSSGSGSSGKTGRDAGK